MAGEAVCQIMEDKVIIDLHVHTSETPAVPYSLTDLLTSAKAHGLDGLCITDIHTVKGGREAKEIASYIGILVLVGLEACTDCGHYLVFVPTPDELPEISTWIRFDEKGNTVFSSLVEAVDKLGGILVAAHPYDRSIPESPGDSLMRLNGVSAIEVLNANHPALTNEFAEEVAAGVGLPAVGGSDTRFDLDKLGKCATLVLGDVHNEAELIEKILSHDVWPVAIGDLAFEIHEYRSNPRSASERGGSRGGSRTPRRHESNKNSPTKTDGNRFSENRRPRRSDRTPPSKTNS